MKLNISQHLVNLLESLRFEVRKLHFMKRPLKLILVNIMNEHTVQA